MKWSLFALCIGFCIDLLIGDPHGLPHPVAAIGHLISLLERLFRRLFPKTPGGERAAGACIWILTALIAAATARTVLAVPRSTPTFRRPRNFLHSPDSTSSAKLDKVRFFSSMYVAPMLFI